MVSHLQPPIRVGIVGVGVVGSEVVNIINEQRSIARHFSGELTVEVACVRNRQAQRNCDLSNTRITTDAMDLVADANVDVVIELMGGTDVSLELVREALNKGKPVISANKALLALYGKQLFELAHSQQVPLLFEGAVAGTIPIVKVMREALVANKVSQIVGIMNGTCNYILTNMQQHQMDYETVLIEAQKLGYAEADPSFDVQGDDAAHKLALLARLGFMQEIPFEKIYRRGLSHISLTDFNQAKQLGYHIKPLAIAKRVGDAIEMQVQPHLVGENTLIGNINGVLNVVEVVGDQSATTSYCGPGAGGKATASAVIADLIEVAQAKLDNSFGSVYLPQPNQGGAELVDIDNSVASYYLRFQAFKGPEAIQGITEILAGCNINIETIYQQQTQEEGDLSMVALITNQVPYKQIKIAVEDVLNSDLFSHQYCMIPVYQ